MRKLDKIIYGASAALYLVAYFLGPWAIVPLGTVAATFPYLPRPAPSLALLVLVPLFYALALATFIPRKLLSVLEHKLLSGDSDAMAGGSVPVVTWLLLALEAPLAVLSYAAWKAFEGAFSLILRKGQQARIKAVLEMPMEKRSGLWADTLGRGFGMTAESVAQADYFLTLACILKAPRWNTHVNLHQAHLRLPEGATSVTIDIENVCAPNFAWSGDFWGDIDQKTLGAVCSEPAKYSSLKTTWVTRTLSLPPSCTAARYMAIWMRPYIYGDVPGEQLFRLPRVKLDGVELTSDTSTHKDGKPPAGTTSKGVVAYNRFLRTHAQTAFIELMQFHSLTMMRLRGWTALGLTEATVRAVFLYQGGGNPANQWLYGAVRKGTALQVDAQPALLAEHLVYVTVYNRASMPAIPSYEVQAPRATLPACDEDGTWAMRVVRKDGGSTAPAALASVKVALVAA